MKDLESRIWELLNEDGDAPSFGNDDSGSNSTGDLSSDSSASNSQGNSPDNSSSEDGPSFGGEDSPDSSSNDDSSGDESDEGDSSNSSSEDDSGEEKDKDEQKDGEEDEEEKFSAESFDDFLTQTKSKVKLTKISSEPSPIFGSNDTKNHNKYKVTITNENGSVWFYFWDSLYNTENNKEPSQDDVLACFGMDVGSVLDGVSKDEFK